MLSKKLAKTAFVTVEAGQGLEMESEVVEGFSLDKGLGVTILCN
jgi:chaperonin GroEL (HSP60 family)